VFGSRIVGDQPGKCVGGRIIMERGKTADKAAFRLGRNKRERHGSLGAGSPIHVLGDHTIGPYCRQDCCFSGC